MENTLNKEYNRIWIIRQGYFAVYGEYANRRKSEPISADIRPNPQKLWSYITLLGMIEWAKKPTHATVLMRPAVISCTFWLYFLNRNFEEVSNFENSVSQKSLNCSVPDELHAPKELGMFCTWGTLCPEKKGWNALHLRNTRRLKKAWNVLYLRTLYSGRLQMFSMSEELFIPEEIEMFCAWGTLCPGKAWNVLCLEEFCVLKKLEMFRSWGTLCPERAWNVPYLEELCVPKKLEIFPLLRNSVYRKSLKCSIPGGTLCPEKLEMFCTWRNSVSWKSLEWSETEERCVPEKLEIFCVSRKSLEWSVTEECCVP